MAVLGSEGADEIIFKEECKDPKSKKQKLQEYKDTVTSPFVAASRGYL